ncbi:MAG: ABC transporter permease [Acidimicrobiales bacterium]
MTATITEAEATEVAGPSKLRDAVIVAAIYLASIVGALILSALLVGVTGGSWRKVFSALIDGSVRNDGAWGQTLSGMAPLLIVATGAIVSTRAGLVNIGQEGQLLVGAVFAAYLGNHMSGPGPLVIGCALVFGAFGGALWAGIAAALRFGRGVPEVLSTLLLVFVAFPLLDYALRYKSLLLDNDPTVKQQLNTGTQLPSDRRLPRIDFFGNEFHFGVIIALVVVLLGALVLARTVWGFRLRMFGLNPRTAQRMGVSAVVMGTAALVVSGALAGLAGGVLLAGTPDYRITVGYSRSFGWNGLLVALLARNRPLLVIPMAFVFAALRTGSNYLGATGVARDIVDVVQALLVLALLIPPAVLFIRDRRRAVAATSARV